MRTGDLARERAMLAQMGPTALLLWALMGAPADGIDARVAQALPSVVEQYRWFHRRPELSGEESRTAEELAKQLRAAGLTIETEVGGQGVLGVLRGTGAGKGRVVLYRANLDGLPITEKSGLPYASENDGVMHACGHDLQLAIAVGALRTLGTIRSEWSGTVLFVGQPSEETGDGARKVLSDPKLARLLAKIGKPDLAISLHDDPRLPAGRVAIAADALVTPSWTTRLTEVFKEALGRDRVAPPTPSTTEEDFARYGEVLGIPSVVWWVGSADPKAHAKTKGVGLAGLHSEHYAPAAEPALRTGVSITIRALLATLRVEGPK